MRSIVAVPNGSSPSAQPPDCCLGPPCKAHSPAISLSRLSWSSSKRSVAVTQQSSRAICSDLHRQAGTGAEPDHLLFFEPDASTPQAVRDERLRREHVGP